MSSDSASGKLELASCGWYMFESFRSLGLGIVVMRCPFGACNSTSYVDVGWVVSSNPTVGKASKSRLIGWVVYVVWQGSHPHWRSGGVGGVVLGFFLWVICWSCSCGLLGCRWGGIGRCFQEAR
jgi:hypothetical protein